MAIAATIAAVAGTAIRAAEPAYAEGQVWEYRTRSGDEGSLLKIQRIEPVPGAINGTLVYHITIIGVDLGPRLVSGVIGHTPVSKETLDESVTRLSDSRADFGDVEGGIEEWRRADGGIFTIPVAKIVRYLAEVTGGERPSSD